MACQDDRWTQWVRAGWAARALTTDLADRERAGAGVERRRVRPHVRRRLATHPLPREVELRPVTRADEAGAACVDGPTLTPYAASASAAAPAWCVSGTCDGRARRARPARRLTR